MYLQKCVFKEILIKNFHKKYNQKNKIPSIYFKTQPALNDPLRFICRKTKQKQNKKTTSHRVGYDIWSLKCEEPCTNQDSCTAVTKMLDLSGAKR